MLCDWCQLFHFSVFPTLTLANCFGHIKSFQSSWTRLTYSQIICSLWVKWQPGKMFHTIWLLPCRIFCILSKRLFLPLVFKNTLKQCLSGRQNFFRFFISCDTMAGVGGGFSEYWWLIFKFTGFYHIWLEFCLSRTAKTQFAMFLLDQRIKNKAVIKLLWLFFLWITASIC